jgi:hypothetical protein
MSEPGAGMLSPLVWFMWAKQGLGAAVPSQGCVGRGGESATIGGDAVTLAGIVLIAAGVIVALLVVFELLARITHARFLSTVILGADGRTSTSKTFIFLWTLLVGWALIALLIAGQFAHTHHCVLLSAPTRGCNGEEVGLFQCGWRHLLHAGLSGSYLILLGVPAAAGVAAKAITQSQGTGTGFKKPKPPGGPNPFARATEIFSADDGTTDYPESVPSAIRAAPEVWLCAEAHRFDRAHRRSGHPHRGASGGTVRSGNYRTMPRPRSRSPSTSPNPKRYTTTRRPLRAMR